MFPLRGLPAGRARALAANFVTKSSAIFLVHHDALGRHADLPLIDEGAECGCVDRLIEVGVVEHQQRRFAAELEQNGLEMPSGGLGNNAADPG